MPKRHNKPEQYFLIFFFIYINYIDLSYFHCLQNYKILFGNVKMSSENPESCAKNIRSHLTDRFKQLLNDIICSLLNEAKLN